MKNQNGKIFYDKLTYIYLEMPNFKLAESELTSRLDKWLYFIKNLESIQDIPSIFKENVFTQAFEKAELSKLTSTDFEKYEMNLKVYRDNKNTLDYAFDEGKIEVARNLRRLNVDINIIIQSTGLSKEEIEKL